MDEKINALIYLINKKEAVSTKRNNLLKFLDIVEFILEELQLVFREVLHLQWLIHKVV